MATQMIMQVVFSQGRQMYLRTVRNQLTVTNHIHNISFTSPTGNMCYSLTSPVWHFTGKLDILVSINIVVSDIIKLKLKKTIDLGRSVMIWESFSWQENTSCGHPKQSNRYKISRSALQAVSGLTYLHLIMLKTSSRFNQ